MRRVSAWCAAAGVLCLLAPVGCVAPEEVEDTQYRLYDDNAALLGRAAAQAARKVVKELDLSVRETYAFVNAECPRDVDTQPNSVIQDALLAAAFDAGFKALERDDDVLVRMAQEAMGELKVTALTRNRGPGKAFSWDARLECRERAPEIVVENLAPRAPDPGLPQDTEEYTLYVGDKVVKKGTRKVALDLVPVATVEFPTATKLIAYRINEFGIRYGLAEGDVEYARAEMSRRNAQVCLSVRLVDASTGEVEQAVTVRDMVHDFIPDTRVSLLKKQLYRPLSRRSPSYRVDYRPERQRRAVRREAPELKVEEEKPMGPEEKAIMAKLEQMEKKGGLVGARIPDEQKKKMLEAARLRDQRAAEEKSR